MKLSTRQDIQAPIEFVYAEATDFAGFERQALRRGIEIERAHDAAERAPGLRWTARFVFRGKTRQVEAELAELTPPSALLVQSMTGGLSADLAVEFFELARGRTRVHVGLLLAPQNLSARLFIQSLRFSKVRLENRFRDGVRRFGRGVEERFRDAAKAAR